MNPPVLFEELCCSNGMLVGRATLNAERKLNSLSLEMIELLHAKFLAWKDNDNVVAVFFDSVGDKAFCAGGDIRKLYDSMLKNGADVINEYAENFFLKEYHLDYLIHKYPKPIICWGHGIVMGGGVGLMSGCSHRIVTEKSRIAMPEMNIGLYPDVGGTWILNRMPGRIGLFLGMTAAHINGADALFVGMADRFISHGQKDSLLDELLRQGLSGDLTADHDVVSRVCRRHEKQNQVALPVSHCREFYDWIQQATDAGSCAAIAEKIQSMESHNKWLSKAQSTLQSGCPVTAHIVYQQLKRGKHLSLREVFQMELVISIQCTRHGDFPEGVRALLVDKDNNPQWQYEKVDDVPGNIIERHFTSPWYENPLEAVLQKDPFFEGNHTLEIR